jgi:two-component system, OmpR family, sensor histidine kinase VicK
MPIKTINMYASHLYFDKLSYSGSSPKRTEVIYGRDKVIEEVLRFVSNTRKKMDACVDHTRPELAIEIEPLKRSFANAKKRGTDLRYVTEITNDNISYCKELMKMTSEIRHLDGIKGNFYISDTEYIAPAAFHEKGKPASQMIYSNLKEIVEHQQYVFDTLWNKAIPSEQKIREIEEAIEPEFFEVITDHEKASEVLVDLAKSVKKEALFFLPNDKAMVRIDRLGIIDYLIKASKNESGANIKIICPLSEENSKVVKRVSETAPDITILNGNNSPYGMYIVDGQKGFRAELKEPKAETFSDAIGFSVYSNRRNTVDFFKSVFELLWNERKSNEELINADKMQKEFINIAAHELRTPIQPMLGLLSLLRSKKEDIKKHELDNSLDLLIRNAQRLKRLSEDILDVTKIESQSLKLNKELFSLNDVILNVIQDSKNQVTKNRANIKIVYKPDLQDHKLIVEADRHRINQVIFNLLSNAIKFTEKDGGVVYIRMERRDNDQEVIVSVKDTGTGVAPDMLPRLFEKFASKSFQGTGLGLFISKNIIEAHGGKIWGENNVVDGKLGASFYFSLPIAIQQEQTQEQEPNVKQVGVDYFNNR